MIRMKNFNLSCYFIWYALMDQLDQLSLEITKAQSTPPKNSLCWQFTGQYMATNHHHSHLYLFQMESLSYRNHISSFTLELRFFYSPIFPLIPVSLLRYWRLSMVFNAQCSSGFIIVLFVWKFRSYFIHQLSNGWRMECEKALGINTFNHLFKHV